MTANLAFGIFLLGMAIVLAVMAWRMARADKENARLWQVSAAWATIAGVIRSSRVDEQRSTSYDPNLSTENVTSTYEPKVEYSYAIGGRDYTGSRISFARLHFASEKKAKAIAEGYAIGSTVTIAYDPADPQNSVLDRASKPPKISFWTGFVGVAAVIVVILAVIMLQLPS
jgi:hypothetical protein